MNERTSQLENRKPDFEDPVNKKIAQALRESKPIAQYDKDSDRMKRKEKKRQLEHEKSSMSILENKKNTINSHWCGNFYTYNQAVLHLKSFGSLVQN